MSEEQKQERTSEGRREFLRKSVYAAYATPVVTAMLVEKASASNSWNCSSGRFTSTGITPRNIPVSPHPAPPRPYMAPVGQHGFSAGPHGAPVRSRKAPQGPRN